MLQLNISKHNDKIEDAEDTLKVAAQLVKAAAPVGASSSQEACGADGLELVGSQALVHALSSAAGQSGLRRDLESKSPVANEEERAE